MGDQDPVPLEDLLNLLEGCVLRLGQHNLPRVDLNQDRFQVRERVSVRKITNLNINKLFKNFYEKNISFNIVSV